MYPNQRGSTYYGGGGDGMGDHSSGDSSVRRTSQSSFRPNPAFADFMRSNDPNASDQTGGGGNSGFSGGHSSSRPFLGRETPSTRMTTTGSRRATSAAARMPSTRSIQDVAGPMEPAMEGQPPAGMQGVAMGMYEGDAYSGGSGGRNPGTAALAQTNRYSPPGAGGAAHRMVSNSSPPPASLRDAGSPLSGGGSVGYLPNAPYQEMLQNYGREDPSIQRARHSMAAKPKPADRPYPVPGPPQEPTNQAIEPTLPASRLGRRMLTHRPERQPDYVVAKLSDGQSSSSLDCTLVECVACRATVEIPKSTVMLSCPSCDQVHPAASCRAVQAGQ